MNDILVIALVHLIDGGVWGIQMPPRTVAKLDRLVKAGYKGKQLIDELMEEDIVVPPSLVVLRFARSSGRPDITIPYN